MTSETTLTRIGFHMPSRHNAVTQILPTKKIKLWELTTPRIRARIAWSWSRGWYSHWELSYEIVSAGLGSDTMDLSYSSLSWRFVVKSESPKRQLLSALAYYYTVSAQAMHNSASSTVGLPRGSRKELEPLYPFDVRFCSQADEDLWCSPRRPALNGYQRLSHLKSRSLDGWQRREIASWGHEVGISRSTMYCLSNLAFFQLSASHISWPFIKLLITLLLSTSVNPDRPFSEGIPEFLRGLIRPFE